jgi:hypothetical protein
LYGRQSPLVRRPSECVLQRTHHAPRIGGDGEEGGEAEERIEVKGELIASASERMGWREGQAKGKSKKKIGRGAKRQEQNWQKKN